MWSDDGDDSPSPAPVKKAPAPTPAAPAVQRNVPGAGGNNATRGGDRGGQRGGRYPSRGGGGDRGGRPNNGGERNYNGQERPPRNTGPTADEGVAEGMETPGGFDGERVGGWFFSLAVAGIWLTMLPLSSPSL